MAGLACEMPPSGFSFENCRRNNALSKMGYPIPTAMKTGTTICGIIYKDGVILASDTRATSGNIIATKNCQKLHRMANKIFCAGAGTAADCDMMTAMMASNLELHRLNTGRDPRISTIERMLKQHLYRYQGHIGCALIIGGVDSTGAHLCSISPHGNSFRQPYLTMGSGSLNADAVLESRWRPDMELEEAKKLVRDAIAAGIFNDLMSGSNVDIVVITNKGSDFIRPYDIANIKGKREGTYNFAKGATAVLSTKVIPLDIEGNEVRIIAEEPMDI